MCLLQNGSIWDGLVLWKSSLDKRFEGVEECYICFAILHNPSHQLPKLSCHTCRKKFHSHCLVCNYINIIFCLNLNNLYLHNQFSSNITELFVVLGLQYLGGHCSLITINYLTLLVDFYGFDHYFSNNFAVVKHTFYSNSA